MTDLIARLEALEKEATPGPWTHRRGYVLIPIGGGVELIVADCAGGDDRFHWARQMQENGSLIVELRNDLPAILHALKVTKAAEAWVEARQTIDEQPLRWALVRAVKGEQG